MVRRSRGPAKTFVERLREQAEEAMSFHESGEPEAMSFLRLWADLNAAADLLEAQEKELAVHRRVAPPVIMPAEGTYGTSYRRVDERGFMFEDYDAEALHVQAHEHGDDVEEDTSFAIHYQGEGPVVMNWHEFTQFCTDGFDLMEKLQKGTLDG